MRIALIILIGIHGIIHLFGFLKAFGIAEFNSISKPVSKIYGVLWLVAFLVFLVTLILVLMRSNYWWIGGFSALIISQVLIFNYWSDAKFGTIANVIILFATIVAYANYNFKKMVADERVTLFEDAKMINQEIVVENDISDLPPVIQKWLISSGAIGKPIVSNVHLTQELELRLKPEQAEWSRGTAEQYFTIQPPAFNWNINTEMNAFLSVVGRDKFKDGKGEMVIKLLSLIPVANAKNNAKVDQATLQRYLAEIVWFPSASLSPYIKWEQLNNHSAKATMEFRGTKGSGVFYFDENGNFEKFTAMRYKSVDDKDPTEWIVKAIHTKERNGIKIPVECEASWTLANEKWTWLKLKIGDIDYNFEKVDDQGF